jgi:integrase
MSIRKLPDGRYEWRHRVGGRHLKKTFTRRTDAVDHDSKVRADLARGAHVDMTNRTTVAEYFQQWIDARVLRARTAKTYTGILRNHLEPLPLGSRPLVKVRPSEIQAWVRDRAQVIGPATLRMHVVVLRGVFATAVLDGLIARNPVQPASRLSLPKADKPKIVPLTIAQVQAWADAAGPRGAAMILTQAGLGLRISELLALRVQDVDFLRREVHITEQLSLDGRRVPLKTSNSRRVVPLPSVTSEVLARRIQMFPPGPGGLIFTPGPRAEFRSNGFRNAGRPARANGTWSQSGVARMVYRPAAVAAGLPDGTSSHSLRHHYVSVLLDAGESVHAVAERIGDTPAMVLDTYGHMMPDREDTTRKAVDAAWQAAGKAGGKRKSGGGTGRDR